MDAPPVIHYLGDRDKALTLKGYALSHYNRILNSMGNTLTANRTDHVGDGIVINCIINTDAYGNKTGMIRVFAPVFGGEENLLFCASFNPTVDEGMQIYENPYPPITKGGYGVDTYQPVQGSYDPNVGFDYEYSLQHTPEYKVGNDYWVNKGESKAISWWVDILNNTLGSYLGYARLAINGIETNNSWGCSVPPDVVSVIPSAAAIISDNKLIVVYVKNIDVDSIAHHWIATYEYIIGETISLTEITKFEATVLNYDVIYGSPLTIRFLDTHTIVYCSTADNGSYIAGGVVAYIELSPDYTTIIKNEVIDFGYDPLPVPECVVVDSGCLEHSTTPPDFYCIHTWEKRICNYRYFLNFETRQESLFIIVRTRTDSTYQEEKNDGNNHFYPKTTVDTIENQYWHKWNKKDGLTTVLMSTKNSSSVQTSSEQQPDNDYIYTQNSTYRFNFVAVNSASDTIYFEGEDIWKRTYLALLNEDIENTHIITGALKSLKLGHIEDINNMPNQFYHDAGVFGVAYNIYFIPVFDYSYTRNCMVFSFYYNPLSLQQQPISFVLDYKYGAKHRIEYQLINISLTGV